jgi:hypothetical protein
MHALVCLILVAAGGWELPDDSVLVLTFDKKTLQPGPDAGLAKDLSGKRNRAIVHGARVVPGRAGTALFFDGKAYVEVLGSEMFNPPKGFTICCWIRAQEWKGAARDYFICKADWDNGVDKGFLLRCHDAVPDITFGTDRWEEVTGKDRLETGRWYHLAATYDASEARVYVDGELVASQKLRAVMTRSNRPLRIGQGTEGDPTRNFMGAIDEVAVFERPLKQEEIQAIYKRGLTGKSLR